MAAASRYGLTLKQLRELMENRGREGVQRVGQVVIRVSGFFFVLLLPDILLFFSRIPDILVGLNKKYPAK